jgi:hypothetical protein
MPGYNTSNIKPPGRRLRGGGGGGSDSGPPINLPKTDDNAKKTQLNQFDKLNVEYSPIDQDPPCFCHTMHHIAKEKEGEEIPFTCNNKIDTNWDYMYTMKPQSVFIMVSKPKV